MRHLNRKRALALVTIIQFIIFVPIVMLIAWDKINPLGGIIALFIVTIIAMAIIVLIVRKFPPADDE